MNDRLCHHLGCGKTLRRHGRRRKEAGETLDEVISQATSDEPVAIAHL